MEKWGGKKWGGDLWDRLEFWNGSTTDVTDRLDTFQELLWHPCGFCVIYCSCEECPLGGVYCDGNIVKDSDTIAYKICRAWVDGDRSAFEEHRRSLVKFMAEQYWWEISRSIELEET